MNILELKHITYAYDRTPVLNDVSMTFEDGACYAIVGPSGAGKTTLLSLMSGLTAIQDGDILYQGKSLRQMNMYDYRSHDAGIIFQHYNLLTKLTALENVELSMEISGIYRRGRRERARALLDMVEMGDRAGHAPSQLSGGQKQRVAIARMLMQRAPIMVFDDSLSAVDAETDAKIRAALHESLGKATVLLISHRVTTLMQADCILVLDGGRVSELGTHAELIAKPGIYRDIYEIQMSSDDRRLLGKEGV